MCLWTHQSHTNAEISHGWRIQPPFTSQHSHKLLGKERLVHTSPDVATQVLALLWAECAKMRPWEQAGFHLLSIIELTSGITALEQRTVYELEKRRNLYICRLVLEFQTYWNGWIKKKNPLQLRLFQYLALSVQIKENTRSLVNRRGNNEILLYYRQICMEKKYPQKAMAEVFTNINEPSRKGIVNITHLASMKAGLIYRMSQWDGGKLLKYIKAWLRVRNSSIRSSF